MPLQATLKQLQAWWRRKFSSNTRSMSRGIVLSIGVGVLAGLAAVVFDLMCIYLSDWLLGGLANYQEKLPASEAGLGDTAAANNTPRLWVLLLLPAIGGLISGVLIYKFEIQAEGHGTDAAVRSFHRRAGRIRLRVPLVKMLTSAVTLSTGGSGGREGPIAQIGAGVGSVVAERLQLSAAERRRLMLAGMAAGVGAIFHAPLAGAIFAIEVLYRDPDFEAESLVQAFLASVVAYSVFSFVLGLSAFEPLFGVLADLTVDRPILMLPPLTALALIMAVAAMVFSRGYYLVQAGFQKLRLPDISKPAIGGLLTGGVGITLFWWMGQRTETLSVMSSGYGFLESLLSTGNHRGATAIGIPLLLTIGLGKMLTTSLTSASGGSGGVFGPSMVIGGSLGGVVGLLFHQIMPGAVTLDMVVVFVILGMASFFAAAASTPVSTLIMVSELTNGYALLLPAMWVCAIAYVVASKHTIYREQVPSRRDSPAHRGDFVIDVLQGLIVKDAITSKHERFKRVAAGTPLPDVSQMITKTLQTAFPVEDEQGNYYGLFSLDDVRQFLYESDLGMLAVAQDLATPRVELLTLDMPLSDAISRFADSKFDELPVIDAAAPQKVLAMLRRQDLLSLYNRTLLQMRSDESEEAAREKAQP